MARTQAAMPVSQIVCAVFVPLIWGCQYAVIKVGLSAFPPLFFLSLRFILIAAVLLPFVGRPTKGEFGAVLVVSLFMGGLNFGLVFVGLKETPASVAGVTNQLWSPFTLILAWPILGEKPTLQVFVGVVVAMAGVVLAVSDPHAVVPFVPTLFVAGSALALAFGSVLAKRYGPFDPMKLMAWMSLFTVPQVLIVSAATETGQSAALSTANPAAWIAFGYTVLIGGILGFGLWFRLIGRFSMARVAPYTLLQAPFAVVAGIAFLHEPLTVPLVAGVIVCIFGVAITQGLCGSWQRHGAWKQQ